MYIMDFILGCSELGGKIKKGVGCDIDGNVIKFSKELPLGFGVSSPKIPEGRYFKNITDAKKENDLQIIRSKASQSGVFEVYDQNRWSAGKKYTFSNGRLVRIKEPKAPVIKSPKGLEDMFLFGTYQRVVTDRMFGREEKDSVFGFSQMRGLERDLRKRGVKIKIVYPKGENGDVAELWIAKKAVEGRPFYKDVM